MKKLALVLLFLLLVVSTPAVSESIPMGNERPALHVLLVSNNSFGKFDGKNAELTENDVALLRQTADALGYRTTLYGPMDPKWNFQEIEVTDFTRMNNPSKKNKTVIQKALEKAQQMEGDVLLLVGNLLTSGRDEVIRCDDLKEDYQLADTQNWMPRRTSAIAAFNTNGVPLYDILRSIFPKFGSADGQNDDPYSKAVFWDNIRDGNVVVEDGALDGPQIDEADPLRKTPVFDQYDSGLSVAEYRQDTDYRDLLIRALYWGGDSRIDALDEQEHVLSFDLYGTQTEGAILYIRSDDLSGGILLVPPMGSASNDAYRYYSDESAGQEAGRGLYHAIEYSDGSVAVIKLPEDGLRRKESKWMVSRLDGGPIDEAIIYYEQAETLPAQLLTEKAVVFDNVGDREVSVRRCSDGICRLSDNEEYLKNKQIRFFMKDTAELRQYLALHTGAKLQYRLLTGHVADEAEEGWSDLGASILPPDLPPFDMHIHGDYEVSLRIVDEYGNEKVRDTAKFTVRNHPVKLSDDTSPAPTDTAEHLLCWELMDAPTRSWDFSPCVTDPDGDTLSFAIRAREDGSRCSELKLGSGLRVRCDRDRGILSLSFEETDPSKIQMINEDTITVCVSDASDDGECCFPFRFDFCSLSQILKNTVTSFPMDDSRKLNCMEDLSFELILKLPFGLPSDVENQVKAFIAEKMCAYVVFAQDENESSHPMDWSFSEGCYSATCQLPQVPGTYSLYTRWMVKAGEQFQWIRTEPAVPYSLDLVNEKPVLHWNADAYPAFLGFHWVIGNGQAVSLSTISVKANNNKAITYQVEVQKNGNSVPVDANGNVSHEPDCGKFVQLPEALAFSECIVGAYQVRITAHDGVDVSNEVFQILVLVWNRAAFILCILTAIALLTGFVLLIIYLCKPRFADNEILHISVRGEHHDFQLKPFGKHSVDPSRFLPAFIQETVSTDEWEWLKKKENRIKPGRGSQRKMQNTQSSPHQDIKIERKIDD